MAYNPGVQALLTSAGTAASTAATAGTAASTAATAASAANTAAAAVGAAITAANMVAGGSNPKSAMVAAGQAAASAVDAALATLADAMSTYRLVEQALDTQLREFDVYAQRVTGPTAVTGLRNRNADRMFLVAQRNPVTTREFMLQVSALHSDGLTLRSMFDKITA